MKPLTEFEGWGKIARLNKHTVITEKIDGTNAAIVVRPLDRDRPAVDIRPHETMVRLIELDGMYAKAVYYAVAAQSRKRFVTPADDNFGFAGWVWDNAHNLASGFGPGRHFGEWWGVGIQRGYGTTGRYFSPFNSHRWDKGAIEHEGLDVIGVVPVPVLYRWGSLDSIVIAQAIEELRELGTRLPHTRKGFEAEGVVVYHTASDSLFKVLCKNDDLPKSVVAEGSQFALAG